MATTEDPWVQFKFRVRASLRDAVDEAARRNNHSLNAEITQRLQRSLEPPEHEIDPDGLRKDLVRAQGRLMNLVRATRDEPAFKSLSDELMEIYFQLAAMFAFTFPASDEGWRRLQERLSNPASETASDTSLKALRHQISLLPEPKK